MTTNTETRLCWSLASLRVTVFLVMFMWTIDKFINPQHAAGIFKNFYGIGGLSETLVYAIGAVELIIVIGFLLGLYRRITYGAVFVLHAISTLSSFRQYMDPFSGPNLLFFAAWPMLAAALTLYLLRDRDRFLVLPSNG